MRPEKQETRRREIEAAAYDLLAETGYRATSMLAVAKRASASNETLYRWYGNKQGLFRSLVAENAREVAALLRDGLAEGDDPLATIERLGPALLRLVTGEKAVALNRAAAADVHETGSLGRTIAAAGRETVAPLMADVFHRARARGSLAFEDTDEIVEVYIGLLIGDLQIRRAIGVCEALPQSEVRIRADRAFRLVRQLYGTGSADCDRSR